MVNMPMSKQDVIDGYNLLRGFADIETDVELRKRNNIFLSGYRIAENIQTIERNVRQFMTCHSSVSPSEVILESVCQRVKLFLKSTFLKQNIAGA